HHRHPTVTTHSAAGALYAPIDPYDSGFLPVSSAPNRSSQAGVSPHETTTTTTHTRHPSYPSHPTPQGLPVVFLHGRPGGVGPDDSRYFDPAVYRIILFDQRSAGESTPTASLEDNTWAFVADIEALRARLAVDRGVVFCGSWGSTFALTYAIRHASEIDWFYQPFAFHIFLNTGRPTRRPSLPTSTTTLRCGVVWSTWEMATSKPRAPQARQNDTWADQFARIECHYFVNEGFFEKDGWTLDNVDKIRHIPAVIVQGRYDVVCPATTAWELHRKWPEAEFHLIADAGHSAKEEDIRRRSELGGAAAAGHE
ncbi:Alpha/Beta hydrolase protein, partial [Zopfochytrium polystomum]